ncbi:LysM peptidoglycan-binding domain-containing protein [Agilicoccus flavus]|uniref:LysM peptidoglycan-binding domain-containing protein n=1 Tax=Agilicoccus flavus TaxID=2775968 RepID=UPI001CF6430D|nr:LysM peptidoglycan-binding domain-containing protein [Agilicoccus flavus]
MSPASTPVAHVTLPFAELSHVTPVAHVRALQARPAPHGWGTYEIRSSDTLFEIALRHRTSVDALAARNGMPASTVLRPGQAIFVPRTAPAGGEGPGGDDRRAGSGRDSGYVVRPGDTIGAIAERFGVGTDALLAANGLTDPRRVLPGRRLVVPAGRDRVKARTASARSDAARMRTRIVTVRPGDGIGTLAARHGVSRASLLKANDLAPGVTLHPGMRLRVVGVRADAPAATAASGIHPRVTAAARANRAHLETVRLPSRTQVRDMIVAAARRHGVDPSLALAVGWQESRWSQRAVSEKNAIGVMQCLPSTGRWVGTHVGRDLDLLATRDNITCGVGLLRSLLRSASSEREAVAAYYQGLASVRANGLFDDTQAYVESVLSHRERM